MTSERDNRLHSGERQVAPILDGIREDHRLRYALAAEYVTPGCDAVDLGCGCGYGSAMLDVAGALVTGFDVSAESVDYAREHYGDGDAVFMTADLDDEHFRAAFRRMCPRLALVTCLEVLEHVEDDAGLLAWCYALLQPGGVLVVSAPNSAVWSHEGNPFHRRHYSPGEFNRVLEGAGFTIERRRCQVSLWAPAIVAGWDGATMIAVCRK